MTKIYHIYEKIKRSCKILIYTDTTKMRITTNDVTGTEVECMATEVM